MTGSYASHGPTPCGGRSPISRQRKRRHR